MSLYLYEKRVLKPESALSAIVYPNVFTHRIDLAPQDLFGCSGSSRRQVLPVSASGNWLWNANTGEVTGNVELIDQTSLRLQVNGDAVAGVGSTITVTSSAIDIDSLRTKVGILSFRIPIFTTLHTGINTKIIKYTIECMGQMIHCELAGCRIKGKVCDSNLVNTEMAQALTDALSLFGNNNRLLSALSYYRQGVNLDSMPVGDFTSEVLVNFYKSIEILFGNGAESTRAKVKAIGLYNSGVESYVISLIYVRNSLDVAHSALALMDNHDQRMINDYVERVKHHLGDLLKKLISMAREGKTEFPHDLHHKDKEREKLLSVLRKNMAT